MIMQNKVEVVIFDNKCVIIGEEDENYIKNVAEFVDSKVREIVDQTKTISTLRAVILAAINISDELFKVEKKQRLLQESLKRQEEEIISEIDEVIKLHK